MNVLLFLIILFACLFFGCWVSKVFLCKNNRCCKWGVWAWMIALIWIALSAWYYACCIKGLCQKTELPQGTVTPVEQVRKDYGPLVFTFSSATPVQGIGFDAYVSSILTQKAKNQKIMIVGTYFSDETNDSTFKNLGLARAAEIKNLLKKRIAESELDTSSQDLGLRSASTDEFFPAASFSYSAKPKPSFTSEMEGSKRILYFAFASSQTQIATDLQVYLGKVAQEAKKIGKTVFVTGHTDNIGARQNNQQLGHERANLVAQELIRLGLPSSQVEIASKGESMPIASNDTTKGRAKNRRVEIEFR